MFPSTVEDSCMLSSSAYIEVMAVFWECRAAMRGELAVLFLTILMINISKRKKGVNRGWEQVFNRTFCQFIFEQNDLFIPNVWLSGETSCFLYTISHYVYMK